MFAPKSTRQYSRSFTFNQVWADVLKKKGQNMNHAERKRMLIELIYKKYGNLSLGRESTATILGISTSSLDRLKDQGLGPKWSKDERSKNGKVTYAIDHIVDYIVEQNIYMSA